MGETPASAGGMNAVGVLGFDTGRIRVRKELNFVPGCDAKQHRRVTKFASGNSKSTYKTAFWEEEEGLWQKNNQLVQVLHHVRERAARAVPAGAADRSLFAWIRTPAVTSGM